MYAWRERRGHLHIQLRPIGWESQCSIQAPSTVAIINQIHSSIVSEFLWQYSASVWSKQQLQGSSYQYSRPPTCSNSTLLHFKDDRSARSQTKCCSKTISRNILSLLQHITPLLQRWQKLKHIRKCWAQRRQDWRALLGEVMQNVFSTNALGTISIIILTWDE